MYPVSLIELIEALMQTKGIKAGLSIIGTWAFYNIIPVVAFLAGIMVLVVADLCSGIAASHKRGIPLTSWGLRRTIMKGTWYFAAVLITHMVQQIWMPGVPIVMAVSSYIAITELKSNLENISFLTGTNIAFESLSYIARLFKK